MKQKICVIGCGWLGLPLAKSLIKKGYEVNGTTRSSEKIKLLQSYGVGAYILDITSEGIIGKLEACLKQCETLILNIPPGLRKNPQSDYVKTMAFLIPFIEASSVDKVLFISSTSVYHDDESFPVITESNLEALKPSSQIIDAESLFQNNSNFKSTMLRFSGLFGEDRHPAKYLAGRNQIKNPNAPVNLIHRTDCISIIEHLIEQDVWGEIFHAATSPHPTKQNYYTSICQTLNLPLPQFNDSQPSKGKIIDSSKLAQVLDYEFQIKL